MATTFPRETTEPQLEVTLEVGTHVLELVVEDSAGNFSEPDTVTVTVVGLPSISSVSPNKGVAGTTIAITGQNFLDVESVSFGGVDTEATVESKTRIIAIVPIGAPLGPVDIVVTTAYGQAISPQTFEVEVPLTIATIEPSKALIGNAITATITGTGLADTTQVAFSDPHIVATVLNSSNTQLEINLLITDQAEEGDVLFVITTLRGQVSSQDFNVYFTVEQTTTISDIIPNEGVLGSQVQASILGTGLGKVTEIEFANTAISVDDFDVISSGEVDVTFTIGPEASAGADDFVVTTQAGKFYASDFGVQFIVIEAQPEMSISRIEPVSALAGSAAVQAIIFGTGLEGASNVTFADTAIKAEVIASTTNRVTLQLQVAADASVGPVSFQVITPQGTVDSSEFGIFFTVTEPIPQMTISRIEPLSGAPETIVRAFIFGTNLEGATRITFIEPGIKAAILSTSSDRISIEINIGAIGIVTFGDKAFQVDSPAGTVNSADFGVFFTVAEELPQATIDGILPSSGFVGSVIELATIRGSGLGGTTNVVFSNSGVTASITSSLPGAVNMQLTIAADAQIGPTSFVVFTPAGKVNSATFDVFFTVSRTITLEPTIRPTVSPTISPTIAPTVRPTVSPTISPTVAPTLRPTVSPTISPTIAPPTLRPTVRPTISPTISPTIGPIIRDLSVPAPSTTRSVTEVSGIGPKYETKLAEANITSLDQLTKLDAAMIAQILEVSEVRAMSFIDEAKRLLK